MQATPAVLMGGRYRPSEQLAVGGMGEIWLGEDTVLQRPIAIKMLRADYASDPEFRERFRAEARHAAGLTHPNITQIFDFADDEPESPPYIVMEYVDGESLAAILHREAPFDADRTWSILGQTSAALAAAHRIGIVHRDIKPGNILVCHDGRVKVTDFGIARAFGAAHATHPGLVLGTAQYLAPEQLAGEQATPASDMYALGVVGYQCLTGKALFSGDTSEVLQAVQAATPPALPSDVPPGLAELIRGLLARDPAERPSDAEAIAGQAERMVRAASASVALDEAASSDDAYPAEPTQAVAAPQTLGPMTSVLTKSPRRSPRTVLSTRRPSSTALAVGVLVALLVAAALIARYTLTTGPSRHGAGGNATPGASTGQPVTVSGATLFGSGDHPEELQNVTDSSPSTAWFTEHYASADFGGLKSGVGLRLQISSTAAVKTVAIRFADPGVAASLYAGTDAVSQGQSKPLATTSSAPTEWRVVLPSPVNAQTWMIWITRLVPDSGGYRAGVANVDFYA
jgi:serine/threonine protein kinase